MAPPDDPMDHFGTKHIVAEEFRFVNDKVSFF